MESISHWALLILPLMNSRSSGRAGGVLQAIAIVLADVQRGHAIVIEADSVFARVILFEDDIGRHVGHIRFHECCARLGVQHMQLIPNGLDQFDRVSRFLGDLWQAVFGQVFQDGI